LIGLNASGLNAESEGRVITQRRQTQTCPARQIDDRLNGPLAKCSVTYENGSFPIFQGASQNLSGASGAGIDNCDKRYSFEIAIAGCIDLLNDCPAMASEEQWPLWQKFIGHGDRLRDKTAGILAKI
jgi:hypothetical protein